MCNEQGIDLSIGKTYALLEAAGITYKCTGVIPFERNSRSTMEIRQTYSIAMLDSLRLHGDENWFYLDEVGFNGNFVCSRARALKGVTPEVFKNNLSTFQTSCCAVVSKWGLIAAKFKYGGYTNDTFGDYALQIGERFRAKGITNARFILDNVRFHKNENAW